MSDVVNLGQVREAKEQAEQESQLQKDAENFADETISKVLFGEVEKYETKHVEFLLEFVEKPVVYVQSDDLTFEETTKENVLKGTSHHPFTIQEIGDNIIRLDIDRDYYYDLYLDQDEVTSRPEMFELAKEYLQSMNDINFDIKETRSEQFQLEIFGTTKVSPPTEDQLERLRAPLDPGLKAELQELLNSDSNPAPDDALAPNMPAGSTLTVGQLKSLQNPVFFDDDGEELTSKEYRDKYLSDVDFSSEYEDVPKKEPVIAPGEPEKPKQVIGDLIRQAIREQEADSGPAEEVSSLSINNFDSGPGGM